MPAKMWSVQQWCTNVIIYATSHRFYCFECQPQPPVLVCWFDVLYGIRFYCTTLTVRNVHICIDECNMTCVISPPGNGGAIYHFHNTPLMFTRATIGTNYSGGAIEGVILNRREYSSRSAMICVMTHLTPV